MQSAIKNLFTSWVKLLLNYKLLGKEIVKRTVDGFASATSQDASKMGKNFN